MKTLSLSRPLILMLVGLPGSGKSFFARQFADMLTAPTVSYDRVRFELFTEPQFSAIEQEIVGRITNYQMQELVKTKRSFIIDGGCNVLAERKRLNQFAQTHGYDTLVIWVQTDEITCRRRATKRTSTRIDDSLSPSITETQWMDLAKHFTAPNREPHIVISGKHAFSTQAKMVLRRLTGSHVDEVTTASSQQLPQRALPPVPPRSVDATPRARTATTPPRRNVVIS